MERKWRSSLWGAIIAAGVALLILAMSASPRARLRATGAPADFVDLVAEPTPDGGNVAAVLHDARPLLERVCGEVQNLLHRAGGGLLPHELRGEAIALVRDHSDAIEAVREAADLERYASLLTAEEMADPVRTLDTLSQAKPAARLLSLKSRVQLAEGDIEGAARTTAAALYLARMYEREPFLINRMIAASVQIQALRDASAILSVDGVDPRSVELLAEAVEPLTDRSGFRAALESERVQALHNLEQLPPPVGWWERGPVLNRFKAAIVLADRPIDQIAKQVAQPDSPAGGALARLLDSGFKSAFETEVRVARQAGSLMESLQEIRAADH